MSRLNRMALALVGLVLVATPAANAGLPPNCPAKAAATPWKPKLVPRTPAAGATMLQPSQPGVVEYSPTIDAGSQGVMDENHVPPPPGMKADGTCVACQGGTLPVPAGTYVSYRSVNGGRMVASNTNMPNGSVRGPVGGDRAPAPPTMVASGGEAPGHAVAGGVEGGPAGYATNAPMTAMGEPVPVGVMRTGFRPQADPMMAAATTGEGAPGHAVAGGMPTAAAPEAFAGPMARSRMHSRTILKHFLGMDELGRHAEERQAQAREAHAMMTYGSTSGTTDVPVSSVYGR